MQVINLPLGPRDRALEIQSLIMYLERGLIATVLFHQSGMMGYKAPCTLPLPQCRAVQNLKVGEKKENK